MTIAQASNHLRMGMETCRKRNYLMRIIHNTRRYWLKGRKTLREILP